jgi:hypothetical protein
MPHTALGYARIQYYLPGLTGLVASCVGAEHHQAAMTQPWLGGQTKAAALLTTCPV